MSRDSVKDFSGVSRMFSRDKNDTSAYNSAKKVSYMAYLASVMSNIAVNGFRPSPGADITPTHNVLLQYSNAFKLTLQALRHKNVYSDLQKFRYSDAMDNLGFTPALSKKADPNKANEESILNSLPDLPMSFRENNPVDVNRTRGCIIPAHLFEKSTLSVEDYLFFQYNFPEYSDNKKTNLDEATYLGYGASREVWTHGGRRSLNFELFFDATKTSMNEDFFFSEELRNDMDNSVNSDPHARIGVSEDKGTLDIISKLQSYRYPIIEKEELDGIGRARFYNGLFEPSTRFKSAPIVYLILGRQFYMGFVDKVDVKHLLMSKDYIPIRSKCNVSFTVEEWDVRSDVGKEKIAKHNEFINDVEKMRELMNYDIL